MKANERAYRQLRDEIINAELQPGTVLGEVETSTRLGVSRTPLREALFKLVSDGFAAPLPGRGIVVTDVSIEGINELFELRQALEQQAARLAALRRNEEVFTNLHSEFVATRELLEQPDPSRREYYALVQRFDLAMDEAVNNVHMVNAINNVRQHLARIRRLSKRNPQRLLAAANEHLQIVDAIVEGDPELAAHATHLHLHNSLKNILATTKTLVDKSETHSEIAS